MEEKGLTGEELLIEEEALRLMIERKKRWRTHFLYLSLHTTVYETILVIAHLLRLMELSTA